jgi:hypothetical protein
MKMNLSDLYSQDARKACRLALRRTVNPACGTINKLLGGHGTEAIRGEWQNGYWCDIVACYVNFGAEFGIMFVADLENLQLHDLAEEARKL